MTYVFTFLGEFGYELFNWQGVVRKFAGTIAPSDSIVCCSRANLYPLYETASRYVDIAEAESFRGSTASMYYAMQAGDLDANSKRNRLFCRRLREDLTSFILRRLGVAGKARKCLSWRGGLLPRFVLRPPPEVYVFVFSCEKRELNGCIFGCNPDVLLAEAGIYESLDLDNNVFKRIEPDLSVRGAVEEKLGWDLETPFVLCQTRSREIVVRSEELVPKERLIEALARRTRVVQLSFSTGRHLDSYSSFADKPNCSLYHCGSFVEQACLVHFARHCLFFTEGDFGSHIYVPPFLGKDVVTIAPADVYELGTTPIDFWNRTVFRFGGQIIPKISEQVFASDESMMGVADGLLSR
jgi:hypothetical protein